MTKYDDYDWEELPQEAKDAAQVLGYNEELWDGDKEPPLVKNSDWDDLNEEQQAAAAVLGYNEALWDDDESSSSNSSDDE